MNSQLSVEEYKQILRLLKTQLSITPKELLRGLTQTERLMRLEQSVNFIVSYMDKNPEIIRQRLTNES